MSASTTYLPPSCGWIDDSGLRIELVVDVADDLLEHVLDRREARHAAVLVDDDGHVVAALAKLR